MPYSTALWVGALCTIAYVFIGGFLAVSWTDTIQASMMITALILAPVIAWLAVQGHLQPGQDLHAIVAAEKFDLFRGASFVDRKSTRLNSSHLVISYAVFCL